MKTLHLNTTLAYVFISTCHCELTWGKDQTLHLLSTGCCLERVPLPYKLNEEGAIPWELNPGQEFPPQPKHLP